jgi:Porin PorA
LRRIVGFVLLGLGVFAVALGLLLRLYAYPRLAKVPLDPRTVSVATGSGVTALVMVKQANGSTLPEIRNNLDLTANRYVTGDLTQPEVVADGDVASWIEAVELTDQEGNRVRATERRLCLDRHTSEGLPRCTSPYIKARNNPVDFTVIEEKGVAQPGLNLKFPFDTEQTTYRFYDVFVRDATEARFEGEEEIEGLSVYRFVQDIAPRKIEDRQVPGSLVGSGEPTVQVGLYYQNRRTMWVEPQTGQIIKGQEIQRQELVGDDQEPGQGTVVFDGTLTFTEDTVTKNVSEAKENRSRLWLLTTLPIFLWVGGAVLILAAVALLFLFRGGPGRRFSSSGAP